MSIRIQVSKNATGLSLKIDPSEAYSSFDVYQKKDTAPIPGTDVPLYTGVSGNLRSVDIPTPSSNGVWYYMVVGDAVTQSPVDFIIYDATKGYRSELKAAIYNRLIGYSPLVALVSTQVYAGFPQTLTTYPAVIFYLDDLTMPIPEIQEYESLTLKVKVFSRSQAVMDSLCDYVNQAIIDYSYQGKEAVIYHIKKFSETGTQLEADGQTLSVDMFFRLTTERLTLPKYY